MSGPRYPGIGPSYPRKSMASCALEFNQNGALQEIEKRVAAPKLSPADDYNKVGKSSLGRFPAEISVLLRRRLVSHSKSRRRVLRSEPQVAISLGLKNRLYK